MKKISKLFILSLFVLTGCDETSSLKETSSSIKPNTSLTSDSEDDGHDDLDSSVTKADYQVLVKDEEEKPVKNVRVQWCTVTQCYLPVKVDDNGVAKTSLDDEETYYVHLLETSLNETQVYNPNELVQNKNKRDGSITIRTLKDISDISSVGVYTADIGENKEVEYTFNLADGSYTIESWWDYTASTSFDSDFNPSITIGELSDDDSGNGKNFKLDFTVSSTSTKTFKISANKKNKLNFFIQAK